MNGNVGEKMTLIAICILDGFILTLCAFFQAMAHA